MASSGSVIIFGGSGFVGMHLAWMLGERFQKVFIADIRNPKWHCQDAVPDNPRAVYVPCDVRNEIDAGQFDKSIDCIVNLAAVHTSPGHPAHEYFETNILGARNITALAEKLGTKRIVFTSSISVYGPSEDEKNEDDIPMPSIPYGSSKTIAEFIHREWLNRSSDRKLSIMRPAVIFGAGEGGNFTRIANMLQRGFFPYPGRKDTIKGCLYVKDICRFIIDRMAHEERYSLYNFCYPEKITTETIVRTFKQAFGYRAFTPLVPLWLVNTGAGILRLIKNPFIERMGLVPDRIVKLVRSTNISSQKLVKSGFEFKYPLPDALRDWSQDCKGKALY